MTPNKIKAKTYRYVLLPSALLVIFASSLFFSSCSGPEKETAPEPEKLEYKADREEESPGLEQDLEQPAKSEPENNCNYMGISDDPQLPRVGLYGGKGSWSENVEITGKFLDYYGFEWSLFDENEAVDLNLEDHYDLLWFPGGFAAEYKNFISDHSNIRDFVKEGGLFVGSCAGAYYASAVLRWQGTDYEYPLKLFAGKGVGPLSGLIGWGETGLIELKENHPANSNFDHEKEMYYFDGPYFEPEDGEAVTVLARYHVNDEPAVISGEKGAGKYLLLGPHPEIGGYSEQSPQFDPEGKNGGQWPWLHQVLVWFSQP